MAVRAPSRRRLLAAFGLGGLITVTDFPDWQAPQAHATAISITGAPLLNLKAVLSSATVAIPAGGTVSIPVSGALAVSQIAYEFIAQLNTAAAVATRVIIELQWIDSMSTRTVDTQRYLVYAGTVAAPHNVRGIGPSTSDQLAVNVTAPDAAVNMSYTFLQSSRPRSGHLWRTMIIGNAHPSIPGFTFAPGDPAAGILIQAQDSVVASGQVTYLLPLYTGSVLAWFKNTDPAAGNGQWVLSVPAETGFPTTVSMTWETGQPGFSPFPNEAFQAPLVLPGVQATLQAVNNNTTTAQTFAETIFAASP